MLKAVVLQATRNVICAAVTAMLAPFAAAHGIPIDETGFTEHVAALLRKEVGVDAVMIADPLTIKIGSLQADLTRIFGSCKAKPGRCSDVLDEYVKAIARVATNSATPPSEVYGSAHPCSLPPGVSASRIIPVVRGTKSVEREFPSSPRTAVTLRINDELTIVFAEDTPGGISYFLVPASEVPCWRNSDTLSRSLENLPRALGRLRIVEVEPTLYLVAVGGNYEASLILLGSSLRRFAPGAAGDLVVGIPNRDVFLITGNQNFRAVTSLRTQVKRHFSTLDRPISDKLFVVSDRSIEVLGD